MINLVVLILSEITLTQGKRSFDSLASYIQTSEFVCISSVLELRRNVKSLWKQFD